MTTTRLDRKPCPRCGAECMPAETNCWQCGARFGSPSNGDAPAARVASLSPEQAATDPDGLVNYSELYKPPPAPPPKKQSIFKQLLTGEMVEVEESGSILDASTPAPLTDEPAGAIGGDTLKLSEADSGFMRLTYCKDCGQQNEEEATKCRKCGKELELVAAGSVKEIQKPPRTWAFDLLGLAWIVLGIAAVYCGWFLVKTDAERQGVTWGDYFWTGVVVCAPGILIFLRHYLCKVMFWIASLASTLVWSVLGLIWILGHLKVSDNGQVGLIWLASLSLLSAFSYFVVRQNEEFEFGL